MEGDTRCESKVGSDTHHENQLGRRYRQEKKLRWKATHWKATHAKKANLEGAIRQENKLGRRHTPRKLTWKGPYAQKTNLEGDTRQES